MSRIDGLLSRIADLESASVSKDSGIDLIRNQLKLRRDLGRDARLDEYPPEVQKKIREFAQRSPDRERCGQITFLAVKMCKKLIDL